MRLADSISPWWTILFPLVIPPASNGWSWQRRPLPSQPHKLEVDLHSPELVAGLLPVDSVELGQGWQGEDGKRYVMGDEEGLTDDEEGGGGWMD
jgi:palmitoyltransferase